MPQTTPDAHPRRWLLLLVLCLSVLLVTVDNTIVNVALPTLSRDLTASTSQLQWIVDAYTLVFAGLLLVSGYLGDRFGRRRMLQAGLIGFAVTSGLAALAGSAEQLIAGRAAMGVAAALIYPATLGLLTNLFTDARERATAIGIWAAISGLAVAIGPVSGGFLLEHFSWNSVFLINLPFAALALAAGRWLPEFRDHDPGRFDGIGALGSVAAITLAVWTVIEAPNHGWTSGTTIAGFAASVAVMAAFVWSQAHRPDPMLDVRLFTNPRFSAASGAVTAAFFGLFGFIFMVTQYFQAIRGYDALKAGLATLPFAVVMGVLSPVAIVLMKRLGSTFVVAGGLSLMSGGFLLAASTGLDSAYWGRIVASMILMAAGLAGVAGPATDAIMGALPAAKAGVGSAVNDTTREVGGTLGVAVIGSAMSSFYGPQVVDALRNLGAPAAATDAARESIIGGLQVAASLPGGVGGQAVAAVRSAFMDGFQAGALTAAAVTAVAAVAVLIFLPARHTEPTVEPAEPVGSTGSAGSGPDSAPAVEPALG